MRQTISTSAGRLPWAASVLGAVFAVSWGALPLALLSSCGRRAPAADVVAQLGRQPIPYAEFDVYLAANAIIEAPSLDSEVLSGLFDQFLEELLLTRLAADEGIEAGAARVAVAPNLHKILRGCAIDRLLEPRLMRYNLLNFVD